MISSRGFRQPGNNRRLQPPTVDRDGKCGTDLAHPIVTQPADAFNQRRDRHALHRVEVDGAGSVDRIFTRFEDNLARKPPDRCRTRGDQGSAKTRDRHVPRKHHHRTAPNLRRLAPPHFTTRRNCHLRRAGRVSKRRQVAPLIRLIQRTGVVGTVRRIDPGGTMLSQKRPKRRVDDHRVRSLRVHRSGLGQKRPVHRCTYPDPCHATIMPHACRVSVTRARALRPADWVRLETVQPPRRAPRTGHGESPLRCRSSPQPSATVMTGPECRSRRARTTLRGRLHGGAGSRVRPALAGVA